MSKKKKTAPVSNVEMSIKAIDGNLGYSDNEVWAYYALGSSTFDFLSIEEKESAAKLIDGALAAIVTQQTKSEECIIQTTSTPLNVEKWARDWQAVTTPWNPTEGYEEWLLNMKNHLHQAYYSQKEVYFGVLVGKRSEFLNKGVVSAASGDLKSALNSAFDILTKTVGGVMGVTNFVLTNNERQYWNQKAEDYTRILTSGNLQARPVSADTIAELFKRTLYPAMPVPDSVVKDQQRWGPGELSTLRESYIEKKHKYVRIIQTDEFGEQMEGYRATLTFARFPDVYNFPYQEPWMHYQAMLGTHHDMFSRFTLEPSAKVQKVVQTRIKEINDEAQNAAQAGQVPLSVQERHSIATDLEFELSNSREPWVFGRHRIVVTASTEQDLRDRVARLRQHYANLDISLVWTSGDQYKLLQESQPADKVRSTAFLQRQSISVISGGMPTANATVGD